MKYFISPLEGAAGPVLIVGLQKNIEILSVT